MVTDMRGTPIRVGSVIRSCAAELNGEPRNGRAWTGVVVSVHANGVRCAGEGYDIPAWELSVAYEVTA